MRTALVLAAALACCSCSNPWQHYEDNVIVTANRAAVEKCERIGPVSNGYAPSSSDEALGQLRHQVVARGGNTLLVTSYTLANDGTAFMCHPTLSPTDRRVAPQRDGSNPALADPR